MGRKVSLTQRFSYRFNLVLEFKNGKEIGIDPDILPDLTDESAKELAQLVLHEAKG